MADSQEHKHSLKLTVQTIEPSDRKEPIDYRGGTKALVLGKCKCGYSKAVDYGDYAALKSKYGDELSKSEDK